MTAFMVHIQNAIADREERGAAMAEYGLLLALVALAAVAILATFGDSLIAVFTETNQTLVDNTPTS